MEEKRYLTNKYSTKCTNCSKCEEKVMGIENFRSESQESPL